MRLRYTGLLLILEHFFEIFIFKVHKIPKNVNFLVVVNCINFNTRNYFNIQTFFLNVITRNLIRQNIIVICN